MSKRAHAKRKEAKKPETHAEIKEAIEDKVVEIAALGGISAAMEQAAAAVELEPPKLSSSVVDARFKKRYTAHAREAGIKGKAARRSNWDWLAQQIALHCLIKDKIEIPKFIEILEANGIERPLERWPNQSRGWEGRLRMTGRVTLQRIVADRGFLMIGKDKLEAPADFIEKYKTKE